MIKKDELVPSFIVLTIVVMFSLWLIKEQAVMGSETAVIVAEKKRSSVQTVTSDKEVSYRMPESTVTSNEDTLIIPKLTLIATVTDAKNKCKALLTVDEGSFQWFYIGDNVIEDYFVHDISRSSVTLVKKSGTYYEISLLDKQPEDKPLLDDDNTDTASNSVSENIQLNSDLQGTDSYHLSQTVTYGDEGISQQEAIEQDIHSNANDSKKTVTYGTEDVSQDIQRQEQ